MPGWSVSKVLLILLLVLFFPCRGWADVAQWDFEGDLGSSTGQAPLTEQVAAPEVAPTFTFEVMTINGAAANVLELLVNRSCCEIVHCTILFPSS